MILCSTNFLHSIFVFLIFLSYFIKCCVKETVHSLETCYKQVLSSISLQKPFAMITSCQNNFVWNINCIISQKNQRQKNFFLSRGEHWSRSQEGWDPKRVELTINLQCCCNLYGLFISHKTNYSK